MAKKKLSALELKLKKLAYLSKAYADAKTGGESVYMAESGATEEGILKKYIFTTGAPSGQTGVTREIGTIDIPKDFLVKDAVVLTVEDQDGLKVTKIDGVSVTPSAAPTGIDAAGEWLDFTINAKEASAQSEESHVYVNMTSFITYTAGSGLTLDGKEFNVALASNPGLEFASKLLKVKVNESAAMQLDANGIGVKVKANNGLAIDTSDGLKAVANESSAMTVGADGLAVKVKANNGIEIDGTNGLAAKVNAASAMTVGADGLAVVANGASALTIDATNGLGVKVKANDGIEIDSANGLKVKVDTNSGLAVDANSGITLNTATPDSNATTHDGTKGGVTGFDKRVINESNTDLLNDAELGSWFGYNASQTAVVIGNISDDSITDE